MNIPSSTTSDPLLQSACKINYRHLLPIVMIAVIGGLLFGFDSGVVNGALGGLQKTFQMSEALSGFSIASTLLGCALGALVSGHWSDKKGRKPVMFWTALLFLFSSIWSGVSYGSIDFIISRILAGVAIGGASVIIPTYISEISPPSIRGRLGSLQQLAIVVGLLGAFLSNYGIIQLAGSSSAILAFGEEGWRWMFMVGAFPAFIFAVGVFFIPESPRYLVSIGKEREAIGFLEKISSADAPQCVGEIQESLKLKPTHSWRDLLDPLTGKLQPLVVVGVLLAIFQQLTGINIVFYYGPVLWVLLGEMFENKNRGSAMALSATALWITNFAVTLLFPICLKEFGAGMIYAGFAGVNFIAFLFVSRCLKETNNQKLEEAGQS